MLSGGKPSSTRLACSAASWHSLLTPTKAWLIPASRSVCSTALPSSKSRQSRPSAVLTVPRSAAT